MQNRLFFSLLNAAHVQLTDRWNHHNVISPFFRLYLIDGGAGLLSSPDQLLPLEKGFLYLIPSFTVVTQTCSSFLNQYYIHFAEETADGHSLFAYSRKLMKVKATEADRTAFTRLLEINPGRDMQSPDNPKVYETNTLLNSFREINLRLSSGNILETQGLIMILLSRFLNKEHYPPATQSLIPSRILDTINYIQTHLSANITVEELAGRTHLSTDHFSRLFYRHTGWRPLQFIHRKRIERAQFLILTTHLSFAEVAEVTGFDSLSHFTRLFKSVTGQTPGYYRDTHLQIIQTGIPVNK